MTGRAVTASDIEEIYEIGHCCLSADGRFAAAAVSVPRLRENRYERFVVAGPSDGPLVRLPSRGGVAHEARLPVLSSEGHLLACVATAAGSFSIEIFDLDAWSWCSPAVAGWPYPIEELTFAPGTERLLFVAREPTDPSWWACPEEGRPPLRVTVLQAAEDGVGWTFNRPRRAYLVPLDGTLPPRVVSRRGFDEHDFAFHPDGEHVVFVSARQEGRDATIVNDVFAAPLDAEAEPRRLTDTTRSCAHPRCSPDGATVAFISVDVARFPSVSELALVPFSGGKWKSCSFELDRDCNAAGSGMRQPAFLDGGGIGVLVDSAGAVDARSLSPSGGEASELVPARDRRVASLALAGARALFVETSPLTPPRLLLRDGGGERALHEPNSAFCAEAALLRPEHRLVETEPGVFVDSWLTLPDERRWRPPHPLIVCLQGGGTQLGWHFSHEFQLLGAEGFATLYLNARGSAGYGNAWQRAVSGPLAASPGAGWGTVDTADVEAVLDASLSSCAALDAERVGVQGGSYGGLVTVFLLARSDRFSAGWAERGPYDLVSLAGTNDESPWFFERYLGRTVAEDPASYWERSPLRMAAAVTAPLLLVHSEGDRRCPIQQAEELFMALKLLGRPVEMLRFPGESHGLSRSGSPVHRLQRLEAMLEWFRRHLEPEAAGRGAGTADRGPAT